MRLMTFAAIRYFHAFFAFMVKNAVIYPHTFPLIIDTVWIK